MNKPTPPPADSPPTDVGIGTLCVVLLLVICAFTNIYITQPVLPVLQQEFGVSAATASLSVSLVILGMALTTIPLGVIADRHSIRPLVLIGGSIVAIAGVVCAVAHDFVLLIAMRTVQGLCIPALTSCVAAYLSRTLAPHRLNVVMGAYVSATVAGGLGGRLLGGWIHPPLHWRYAFVTSAVLLLAMSVLTFYRLRDTRPATHIPRTPMRLLQLFAVPALRRSLFAAFGAFGAFSTVFNYFPFYLAAAPWHLPTATITSLYLAYVVGLAMGPLAGRLSNRLGNARVTIGGVIVFVASLMTTLVPSMPVLVISLVGICAGFFAIHASAVGALNRALASDRGKGNALYTLFYYAGGVTGITAGGSLYAYGGWILVVALCSGLLLLPLGAALAGTSPTARAVP